MQSFRQIAENVFAFLISDFGFSLVVNDSKYQVVYDSPTTKITIGRDNHDGFWLIVAPVATIGNSLGLEWIVDFFAGDTRILSTNCAPPKNKSLTTAQWIEAHETNRLTVYASALRQYGEPFLHGDFSRWEEINTFVIRKNADNNLVRYYQKQRRWWRTLFER